MNFLPNMEALCRMAILAGEAILEVRSSSQLGTVWKEDNSPQTLADQQAQRIINDFLTLHSNLPIVSEESPLAPWAERQHWDAYWLIDPLDGTREFVQGGDFFTVNIALMVANRPFLGVMYAPVLRTLYWGGREQAAMKQQDQQSPTPISVSAKAQGEKLISIGSRLHQQKGETQLLSAYPIAEHQEVSSSIKFAWIAEGRADVYLRKGRIMEWDTAAGEAILTAAGGRVCDLQDRPLSYNKEQVEHQGFWAWGR
jgi:3'(2'), 5'-bisphosphate nucleotidase